LETLGDLYSGLAVTKAKIVAYGLKKRAIPKIIDHLLVILLRAASRCSLVECADLGWADFPFLSGVVSDLVFNLLNELVVVAFKKNHLFN